ncbi:MAG: histidine phosphatase family protein [Gammaproteobacteria bacterium]|nr:histidine phosphatase family protein [Gammaproteobacteria bacterium]
MANIYFVRHGEASATFADHQDPGLSELGRTQAEQTARKLNKLGPLPVLSSPLLRTQETARCLTNLWNTTLKIDARFSEIPTPASLEFAERSSWLNKIMNGSWMDLTNELQSWRNTMIDATLKFQGDCVVYSHFVAINVVVGAASGLSELISFRPTNASITCVSNTNNTLSVVYKGLEATTKVN